MFKFSIRFKIMISFFLAALIIIMVALGYMNMRVKKILINRVTEDVVLKEECDRINQLTKKIKMSGEYMAANKFVAEIVYSDESNEIKRNIQLDAFRQEIKQLYDMLTELRFGEYGVNFYINKNLGLADYVSDGTNVFLSTDSLFLYSTKRVEDENWYKNTMEKNGDLFIFYDTNGKKVYFSQKIGLTHGLEHENNWLGVSVVKVDFVMFLRQMEALSSLEETSFAIIMPDGKIITKSKNAPPDSEIYKALENEIESGNYKSIVSDKGDSLINIAKTDSGIKIISFVQITQALTGEGEINRILLVTMILGTVLLSVMFLLLSHILTHPLQNLVKQLANMPGEDLKPLKVKKERTDEVGNLYSAINSLIFRVNLLSDKVVESFKKEKELEFLNYQLRINPHFLYNALDSIFWKAVNHKQNDIADMASNLSKIFEYSIRGKSQKATLAEEIKMLGSYIKLQKNRYGEGINFEYNLDGCSDIYIPKCLLQPLIENSVIHGFTEDRELKIFLKAEVSDDGFVIYIEDNGKGCCADELNAYLEGDEDILKEGAMGVANVSRRIKLVYGENSGLHYVNNESGGMTAIITIRS